MSTPRAPEFGNARGLETSLGGEVAKFLAKPTAAGKSHPNSFKLISYTPAPAGARQGFAEIETPSGLIFHDTPVFCSPDGQWSAAPSSKPLMRRDGPMLDKMGKIRYAPVVSFTTKQHRDKWSAAVIAALRTAKPEIFA